MKNKFLYLNAVKSLLSDNFGYFYNITCTSKLKRISEKIYNSPPDRYNIVLNDAYGCCADIIFSYISGSIVNGKVYIVEDDLCPGCCCAIYMADNNLFVFNDRFNCSGIACSCDVNFYYTLKRRDYLPHDFLDMASGFLIKRGGIDKNTALCYNNLCYK